jgi:uncharacterized damage-inducible protein DinB
MITADHLIAMYARNLFFIKQLTEGFSHADSLIQPPVPGNCANWVVGHIAVYRERIMTILHQPSVLDEQFATRYARDSKPVLSDEPGISQFADLLHAIEMSQESLAVGLRQLTPEQAEQVLAFGQLKMSVAEWMLFMLRHEAYHTGQLELLQEVVKAK